MDQTPYEYQVIDDRDELVDYSVIVKYVGRQYEVVGEGSLKECQDKARKLADADGVLFNETIGDGRNVTYDNHPAPSAPKRSSGLSL
jgi:hypothetical protein